MKIKEAGKIFPHARAIECMKDGGEFIISRPDGAVVCVLAVHVHMSVGETPGESGTETCVDVFTPDTRGVEVVHFAKEGRATFIPLKYEDKAKRREERGMHMVGIIRRPGGVK